MGSRRKDRDAPAAASGVQPGGEWAPQFEGQRPPFGAGNEAATKDGAHSERRLRPLTEAYLVQIRKVVPTELYHAADQFARRRLASQLAVCHLIEDWLDQHGLFDDGGEIRPQLERLRKAEGQVLALLRELAFTTVSRESLRLQREQLYSAEEVKRVIALIVGSAARLMPQERREEWNAALDDAAAALALPEVTADEAGWEELPPSEPAGG